MIERITIFNKDKSLEIEIKAFKDNAKQKMLLVWIVLFSLCGLAILSQFFFDYDNSSKVFFAVYLAFWFFFEFKVIYAYRWRNSGLEKIILNETDIILIKEIGKRGISQTIDVKEISNLKRNEPDEPSFIKSINSSYWNINKYSLTFDYQGKAVPFAIDLDKNEAIKLLKEIQHFLRKAK